MRISFDTTNQTEVMEVLAYLQSLSADPIEPPVKAAPKQTKKAAAPVEPPPHTDADAPPLRAEEKEKPAPTSKDEPEPKTAPKEKAAPKAKVDPDNVFADKTGEDLRKLAADFLSGLPAEQKAVHRQGIVDGILKKHFNVTSSPDLADKDIPKAYELIFNYIEDNQ